MTYVVVESEHDDMKAKHRYPILDSEKTILRPYLSPKYPPIIFPIISPIIEPVNNHNLTNLLSTSSVLIYFFIIDNVIYILASCIPIAIGIIKVNKLFTKKWLPYFTFY